MTRLFLLLVALVVAVAFGAGCVSTDATATAATPVPAVTGVPYIEINAGAATAVYDPVGDESEVRFEYQPAKADFYFPPSGPVVFANPRTRLTYRVADTRTGEYDQLFWQSVSVTVVRNGSVQQYNIGF